MISIGRCLHRDAVGRLTGRWSIRFRSSRARNRPSPHGRGCSAGGGIFGILAGALCDQASVGGTQLIWVTGVGEQHALGVKVEDRTGIWHGAVSLCGAEADPTLLSNSSKGCLESRATICEDMAVRAVSRAESRSAERETPNTPMRDMRATEQIPMARTTSARLKPEERRLIGFMVRVVDD